MLSVHWLFPIPSVAVSSASSSSSSLPTVSSLASLLPAEECRASLRFVHDVDRMRAAVSRCAVRSFLSLATGLPFSVVPVIRSLYGKPLLDVERCIALLASSSADHSHSNSIARLCACGACLRSVCFSVSHHGEWLLLVGQRACGCHCRSQCSAAAAADRCNSSESLRSSLLGCDVTTTDLPLRHATKYERAWPAAGRSAPPSLTAATGRSLPAAPSAHCQPQPPPSHPSSAAAPYAECGALLSDYLSMFASELSDDERTVLGSATLPTPDEVRPLSGRQAALVWPSGHCLTAFAATWSVKEAVVKAVGLGLNIRLASLHTSIAYTDPHSAEAQHTACWARVRMRCVRPGGDGCVAAAQRQCAVGSVECCRALDWHWQVDVMAVDDRHVAAVARATPTLQQQRHEREHAAECSMDERATRMTLATDSAHKLSPLLRVVSVEEMLAAVGLTAHTT